MPCFTGTAFAGLLLHGDARQDSPVRAERAGGNGGGACAPLESLQASPRLRVKKKDGSTPPLPQRLAAHPGSRGEELAVGGVADRLDGRTFRPVRAADIAPLAVLLARGQVEEAEVPRGAARQSLTVRGNRQAIAAEVFLGPVRWQEAMHDFPRGHVVGDCSKTRRGAVQGQELAIWGERRGECTPWHRKFKRSLLSCRYVPETDVFVVRQGNHLLIAGKSKTPDGVPALPPCERAE